MRSIIYRNISYCTLASYSWTDPNLLDQRVASIRSFTGTRHFSGHCFFHFQRKNPITWKLTSITRKTQNKSCIQLQETWFIVSSKKCRPCTWLLMNFQTWWRKKPHKTQLRTAVREPLYTKFAHFCCKLMIYVKKACSFYFDVRATWTLCDDQGLRYSCPSDLVQLRHISRQLDGFFLSQQYFYLSKSQTWLKKSITIFRIYLGGLFGSNYNLKMTYSCIILHDNFEDIPIFSKKPPETSKVIEKWSHIVSRYIQVVSVPLPHIFSMQSKKKNLQNACPLIGRISRILAKSIILDFVNFCNFLHVVLDMIKDIFF
jgi:hypothetical protein